MSYIDSIVETFKGQDRESISKAKISTGLLLAVAHVTAAKDLKSEDISNNGASFDEVKKAYSELSYDKRLMGRKKVADTDIIDLMAALILCGEVVLVDNNPDKGVRLTMQGMLTAFEMFKNLKPMKESAVYGYIKRAELELELGGKLSINIKLENN